MLFPVETFCRVLGSVVLLGVTGGENDFDLQDVDVVLFDSLFRAMEILDAVEEEISVYWARNGSGK